MNQSILEIFARSNDEHIGQTVERLARLAEVMHQYHAAVAITDECDAAVFRIDESIDRDQPVLPSRIASWGGSDYTEVSR